MGFSLRMNLFHGVAPDAIAACAEDFFRRKKRKISHTLKDEYRWQRWDFYKESNEWTPMVVGYSAGVVERREWRKLELEISERLSCDGFLFFAYDGDYWGYEFFSKGRMLDQFSQDQEQGGESDYWEKGTELRGDVPLLLARFPHLSECELQEHLAPRPQIGDGDVLRILKEYEVRVRPGDKYVRGVGIGVLAFLEYLGVAVSETVEDGRVRFGCGELHRSMWVWNSFFTDEDAAELEEIIKELRAEGRQNVSAPGIVILPRPTATLPSHLRKFAFICG
jgi:hypothetical protein